MALACATLRAQVRAATEHQERVNDTLAAVTLLDSGCVGRAERCRPTRVGVHIDGGDRAAMLRPPGELRFSVRMALMGRDLRQLPKGKKLWTKAVWRRRLSLTSYRQMKKEDDG